MRSECLPMYAASGTVIYISKTDVASTSYTRSAHRDFFLFLLLSSMTPPAAEAAGLALSSADLAQLPVVEGAIYIWQKIQHDYNVDFENLQQRLAVLRMKSQLLHRDLVFDGTTSRTPGTVAASCMERAAAAVAEATGLSEIYIALVKQDQKQWREMNEKKLESLVEEAEKEMEFVLTFYNTYSKVVATDTCHKLEAYLSQVGSGEVVQEVDEEVGAELKEDGDDQEERMVEEEEQQQEGQGSLNPSMLYFSFFVFFVSIIAGGRSARG